MAKAAAKPAASSRTRRVGWTEASDSHAKAGAAAPAAHQRPGRAGRRREAPQHGAAQREQQRRVIGEVVEDGGAHPVRP